jgi:hypothetical protein
MSVAEISQQFAPGPAPIRLTASRFVIGVKLAR